MLNIRHGSGPRGLAGLKRMWANHLVLSFAGTRVDVSQMRQVIGTTGTKNMPAECTSDPVGLANILEIWLNPLRQFPELPITPSDRTIEIVRIGDPGPVYDRLFEDSFEVLIAE